jgi:hypothetical protein
VKLVAPPVHTGAFDHVKLAGAVELFPFTVRVVPVHVLPTFTINVVPEQPFVNVDVTDSFSLVQLHCGSVLLMLQVTFWKVVFVPRPNMAMIATQTTATNAIIILYSTSP